MNENEIKNYRQNKVMRCLSSNELGDNLKMDLKNIKNVSDLKENKDKKEENTQLPSANPESKPATKLNINAKPYNKGQTNKIGLNINSKEFIPKKFEKLEKPPQNSLSNNNLSYNQYNNLNPQTYNNATQFHAKNDYSGHTYAIKDNNNLQNNMHLNNNINTAQGQNIYNKYIPPYTNPGNNFYNAQQKTMPNMPNMQNNFYRNNINTNYQRPPNPQPNPNMPFFNNPQAQNYNNTFTPPYNNFNKNPNMNLSTPNSNINMPKQMPSGGFNLDNYTQKPISKLSNYPHILNAGNKPEIKNETNNNINNNIKQENDKNASKHMMKLNKDAPIFIPGVKKVEDEGKEKNVSEENKDNKDNKENKENNNKENKEPKEIKENIVEENKNKNIVLKEKENEDGTKEAVVTKGGELKDKNEKGIVNEAKNTKPEKVGKENKENKETKEIINEKKEEIKPALDTNENTKTVNTNLNKIKETLAQPVNINNKPALPQSNVQEKVTPKPEPKKRGLADVLNEPSNVSDKKTTTKPKRKNPPQNISQQPPKDDEFNKKLKLYEEEEQRKRNEKIQKDKERAKEVEEMKRQKEIELKEKEEARRLEELRIKKEQEERRLEELRIKKEQEEKEKKRLEELRIQKEKEEKEKKRLEEIRIQKEKEEEEKRKETITVNFYFKIPAHPELFKKEKNEREIKTFDLEYLTSFRNWKICKNETKLIDEIVMKHINSFETKITETKTEILNQLNRSNNYKDYKKKDGGFRKPKDFPRKKESQNLLVVPANEGGSNEGTNLSQWGRKDLTNEIKLAEEFKKNLDEIKKRDPVKFDLTEFLNMLTLDNYDDTKKLIFDLIKDSVDYQNKFLEVLFQKAIVEKSYVTLYAKLCKELDKDLPQKYEAKATSLKDKLEESNNKRRERSVMRKNLLDKCRKIFMVENNEEFDKFVKSDDPDEKEQKKKKFILGNVNFIAELINVQILSKKIVFQCIDNLFKRFDKESTIQSLKFIDLEAIVILTDKFGTLVNKTKEKIVEKDLDNFTGKIEDYIERLKKSENEPNLPGYIKYKIINLIAKKNNGWKETQYEKNIGAKSKAEVKKAYEESKKKFTPESSNNSSSKNTYTQDEVTDKIGKDLINFKDEIEYGEKISSYKWEIISDLYSHNIKLDQMLEGFLEACLDFATKDKKLELAINYWTEVFSYYIHEISSLDRKKLRDKTIELFSYASSLITENKLIVDIWVTVLMEMNKSGNLQYSDLDGNKDNDYKEDLENIFLIFKRIIEKGKDETNTDEIYEISYVKNNMELFNKIMQS